MKHTSFLKTAAFLCAGAALVSGPVATNLAWAEPAPHMAEASPMASAETYLECSVWAQILADHQDMGEEVSAGLVYAAIFFIGKFEGMTGQPFQEALNAAKVNAIGERLGDVQTTCLPLMDDFGKRMSELGQLLNQDQATQPVPDGATPDNN